ncbi:MAG: hypothetical protein HFG72_03585 [Hungatella sp.]|jgi:hypothetical protein|nr:hypothetical protein [Hungatella sp.]
MKKSTIFIIISLITISFLLVSCNQTEDDNNQTEQPLELDSSYESEYYDFLFQYPSQWTITEEPWSPATKTKESDPEKIVDLFISGEEKIVIFDSLSRNGGLFRLVSGDNSEIVNVLGITGTMITETKDAEGECPWIWILAYYEDGYTEGIGMGGSYGACVQVKKETYEQYKELIVEILKSVHMKRIKGKSAENKTFFIG